MSDDIAALKESFEQFGWALTREEWARLTRWAQTTPEAISEELRTWFEEPSRQDQLGQAISRALEPALEPILKQIEAAAKEGIDDETAHRIVEACFGMIEKKLAGFEQRLAKIEAALFRRGL